MAEGVVGNDGSSATDMIVPNRGTLRKILILHNRLGIMVKNIPVTIPFEKDFSKPIVAYLRA